MMRAVSNEGIAVPIEALETVPLFAGMAPEDLVTVAFSMRFRSFAAGTVLFYEGQPGASMHVVLEGLVNELTSAPISPEARSRSFFAEGRLVAKHRRGDAVGLMALLTGQPQSSTAKAVVQTSALELADDDFRALIARFPAMLSNLALILGTRLAEANVRYARAPARGEAVALIAGPGFERSVGEIVSAARSASPRPLECVDARPSLEDALARLDGALREHPRVVVLANSTGPALATVVEQVDRAVAIVDAPDAHRLLATQASSPVGAEIEIVLCGPRVTRRLDRHRTPDGLSVVGTFNADSSDDLTAADVAWLGRHLSRTKLGLALGAGGAKGYAHVGALYVLEQAGYTVDCVAGSSIGAVVGSCVAQGMSAAEIDAALRRAFDEETVAGAFRLSLGGGSVGLDVLARALDGTTNGRSFEDLLVPLTIMTADLAGRQPVLLTEGPLTDALLAATALAGMFPPQERNGHRLVDGVALVPVPTQATIERGADVTVSVNLMGRDVLPAWPGEQPPSEEPRRRSGPRMLETLLEVMDLAQVDASARNAELADVAITPRFGPGTWRDFHLADRFLTAGREETQEQLPALRAVASPQLERMDKQGEDDAADVHFR
jgi:NTE family protein